jgi:hypothetical protein
MCSRWMQCWTWLLHKVNDSKYTTHMQFWNNSNCPHKNVTVVQMHTMEICREVKVHLHSFSATAVDRREYSVSHSSHFILSTKAPRTHWVWGWVGCFGETNLLLLVRIQPQIISSPASNLAVILTMIQT